MRAPPLQRGQRKLILAITGRKQSSPRYNSETAEAAFTAGLLAAEMGFTVLTGGLYGVMEQAARGAKEGGGQTIGILPGLHHHEANSYLDYVLPTGLGIARNCLIASACDFMLALPGGTGTLEEMCFAVDFARPVLSWGSWDIPEVTQVPFPDKSALSLALSRFVQNLSVYQPDRKQDKEQL